MDGWVDGWMGGWVDGRTEGEIVIFLIFYSIIQMIKKPLISYFEQAWRFSSRVLP